MAIDNGQLKSAFCFIVIAYNAKLCYYPPSSF